MSQPMIPQTRHVLAPAPKRPDLPSPANRVIGVDLKDQEDVAWLWSDMPDGQKYVSGYTIFDKNVPIDT